MTKTHLRKQKILVCEQVEEIMSHLTGMARDVVKIVFRSDPTLDVEKKPGWIYDILLHYFSEALSCLPLANFYTSLPKHREDPVDYWLKTQQCSGPSSWGSAQMREADRQHEWWRGSQVRQTVPWPRIVSQFMSGLKWCSTEDWWLPERVES